MEAESSTRQDSEDQNIFSSPSHQEDKIKKKKNGEYTLELDDNLCAKLLYYLKSLNVKQNLTKFFFFF